MDPVHRGEGMPPGIEFHTEFVVRQRLGKREDWRGEQKEQEEISCRTTFFAYHWVHENSRQTESVSGGQHVSGPYVSHVVHAAGIRRCA